MASIARERDAVNDKILPNRMRILELPERIFCSSSKEKMEKVHKTANHSRDKENARRSSEQTAAEIGITLAKNAPCRCI